MNTRTLQPIAERSDYLSASWSIGSWLFSTDHKRIALLYMVSLTLFFFVGGAAAVMMRLELATPSSDVVSMAVYNRLFTVHGTIMVWFFLVPSIPAVLGNFLIPLMVGARDLAFPRLNLASWYVFMAGGVLSLSSILYWSVDTGWTFYTPYSTAYANPGVIPMTLGIFLSGFATIFTGLNFIVTIHTMRAPGLGWLRLPLFIWSLYATSIIIVLATPVLAITLALLAIEKIWGVGIFDPALGGDPVLYQHLFWFYSHPAVYIMILPGFGVVSEIIPCFARKRIFGYLFIALASIAIAVLGFLVWGHHLFVAGQSFFTAMVFSLLSFLIAIPSAIKVFNWTATLHKGLIELTTPMLYALGFIGLFVIGGLTGLFVASLVVDIHVHDTYFVIAHFHYIMVGGMVMAYLGGIHFWWPKISGRMYPEGWGIFSAILIFFGFNLTFFPQFVLGYLGMPRRYATYAEEFQVLHVMSSAGASILGVGYLLPLCYLLWSLTRPPNAPPNPWRATGLEWQTPSPPPPHNFHEVPLVTEGPYAYSAVTDTFIPQAKMLPEADGQSEAAEERPHVKRAPVAHHFEDAQQQHEAATLGMWLFLVTEVMFFGGLFTGYLIYRMQMSAGFIEASSHLYVWIGALNTFVLLGSSLTMALAVRCASLGQRALSIRFLLATIALALVFLVFKAVEYALDVHDGLLPGYNFHAEAFDDLNGATLFLFFYFVTTALHALHMIIGIGVLSVIVVLSHRGWFSPQNYNGVEMTGLYWHFVDIVWIFLFPLYYLIGW